MRFSLFIIFCLLIAQNLCLAANPTPLWNNALQVCETTAKVDQENPKITEDGNNGYFIIFEDKRQGETKLFAQRINELGASVWNENGIQISNLAGSQTNSKIIKAETGSVIITWQNELNGDSEIYAQKINTSGQKLWSKNGIPITQIEKNQSYPEITTDQNGGAIIVWHDLRFDNEDIYIQRVDSTGTPLWTTNGIALTSTHSTQWFPKITSNSQGGAIVVWSDRRKGNFDIYAQKVSSDGKISWETDGKRVTQSDYSAEDPEIVYLDNEIVLTYRIKNNGVYFQIIDNNGNIKLGNQGKKISYNSISPTHPQIAKNQQNELMVVWSDPFAGDLDLYGQIIDKNGNTKWEQEYPLVQTGGDQDKAKIVGRATWSIGWIDHRSGHPEIYAQKIDSSGNKKYAPSGIPIAIGQRNSSQFDLTSNINDSLIMAFNNYKKGSSDIYAQEINQSGNLSWDTNGTLVNSSYGKTKQQNVRIINDGYDNYIYAFEDSRLGFPKIYLQKISSSGQKLWSSAGIAATAGSVTQKNPNITGDGAGGVIVSFENYTNPSEPKILVQRITTSGNRSWNKNGVAVSNKKGYSEQTNHQIVSDQKSGAIIVWEDYEGDYNAKDILAQRITSLGKVAWGETGKIIATGGGDQTDPKVSSTNLIITWVDKRLDGKHSDIYAQKINLDGKLIWEEDGVAICTAPDTQREPNIFGSLIAWTDKGGGGFDIYSQKLDINGNNLWIKDGIAICQSARTQQRPQLSDNVIVWEDFRFGNWDIYAQSVSDQGSLLWQEGGVPIVKEIGTQYDAEIIKVGQNNIIAWDDFRDGEQYSIYLQNINSNGNSLYQENGILVQKAGRMPKLATSQSENSFVIAWEDIGSGEPTVYTKRFKL